MDVHKLFARGRRVYILEGLSAGRFGTIQQCAGLSQIGVMMWRVDVHGHRERLIREDWMTWDGDPRVPKGAAP